MICSNFDIQFANMTYYRDNVTPLVSGISGAWYKGFSTHDKAARFYLDAKEKGLVRIVRDPGDDALFGPLHEAMQ